jgi:hypothetical protein
MAMQETRYLDEYRFMSTLVKAAFVLLCLALVTYLATGGGNAQRPADAFSVVASQTAVAAGIQSIEGDRPFEYFPDRFVNQATTIEEPVATF